MGNACYTVCATLTCNLERQKNVPLWQLVKCIAFEVTIIGVMFAVTLDAASTDATICKYTSSARMLANASGFKDPTTEYLNYYLASECDKISNFTAVFNDCSNARVQAWGAFNGMQLAFKVVSALTLSLIVLRDVFLFLFGVDKRGADIPMVMLIVAVVLTGGLHAKGFYEGYTYASNAGAHMCMIRFDNFMKPAKFALLIGVVLVKYLDYFLVCMTSMIGYFSSLGPRYCMIKPYAEAYDPEMEYGDEDDLGRGPHSDLPDNLKQIAERADRGY